MQKRSIALLTLVLTATLFADEAKPPRSVEQIIARSIALLESPDMPYSPSGYPMVADDETALACHLQMLGGRPPSGNPLFERSPATWKVLPPDFLSALAKAEKQLTSKLPPLRKDHRIVRHPHMAYLQDSLERGYESHAGGTFSGAARAWAAWVVGEGGIESAVPTIAAKLEANDPSPLARAQYFIALARLRGEAFAPAVLALLKIGSRTLEGPRDGNPVFWLPGCSADFDFWISEQSAAAIAAAHLPRVPGNQFSDAIDAQLLAVIDELLAQPTKHPVLDAQMRVWKFASPTPRGDEEDDNLFESVLFAIARRGIVEAFPTLRLYFNSIAQYASGGNMVEGIKGPQGRLHTPSWQLIVTALHLLDAPGARAAMVDKIRELNQAYATQDYKSEAIWQHMYIDKQILGAYGQLLSEVGYRKFQAENPIINHRTHSDFIGGQPEP